MSPRPAHLVRPRWVWGGLVLILLGAGLFALWTATWHAAFGVAGAALLLIGASAAWHGGILYDTHGARASTQELDDLRADHVHRGTAPGDMITDERLRAEARATARMTRELIEATEAAPHTPLDTLGAGLLLAAAAFLVVIQGLYPHTHTGQDNGLRSLVIAIIIGLAALRILLGQQPGRLPSLVAALCGLALVLFATLTDHDRQATVVLEIVVGAWVLVMSVVTLDHPPHQPAPELGPDQRRRHGRERARTPARWADDVRIVAVAVAIGGAVLGAFGLGRRAVRHARHTHNVE